MSKEGPVDTKPQTTNRFILSANMNNPIPHA
jgi:hypothetical protein